MNNLSAQILSLCRLLEPRDDLTVTQWAEKNRELTGRGRFKARPFQREVMDTATDETIRETTLVSAAQIGKTTIVENIAGYFIAHDPKLILVVFPQVELGEAWSNGRLQLMLDESCPGLVGPRRGRDAANTKLSKDYPGGNITIVGANSPAGLRMRDRQVAILDDVNGYPDSAGAEGDVESLVRNRLASYPDAFTFRTSTPTIKRTMLDPAGKTVTLSSRIYRAYERSDMRRWFCCCPRCGQWSQLKWDRVRWPAGRPEDAIYSPDCCNAELSDTDRLRMIEGGEWRKTAVSPGHAGFQISGLAAPFAAHRGYTTRMHEMAIDWLEAQKETEKLKVFINTSLGEDFEIVGATPDTKALYERTEPFGPDCVPNKVQAVTAYCDVQHDRLEMTVCGWGEAEECWVIEHRIIAGDVTSRATWSQLNEAFTVVYPKEDGSKLSIGCLLIDSADGQSQDEVYKFVHPRQAKRIYAARGSSESGAPLTRQAKPTKYAKKRWNIFLVTIGTHIAKGTLFKRLQIGEAGPRYIHFSQTLTTDWFNQLSAESLQRRKKDGREIDVWVQLSARNEALDCMAGNIAAYSVLRPQIKYTAQAAPEVAGEVKPQDDRKLVDVIPILQSEAAAKTKVQTASMNKYKF